MPAAALEALVLAACEPGQPGASFRAFDMLVQERAGCIFTTMLLVRPDGLGERVFTTDPVGYPMPHHKPFPGRAGPSG